jgi:hypothetical protein
VVFPLSQYPSIFHWDTFFHSTTAKIIALQGNFSTGTAYRVYPGTFVFSVIVSDTLGLPILETSILLASFWVFMIALLLFCIGKLLAKTNVELAEASWLVPTIYLALNFRFYNAHNFSPQLLGICLYIILVYVCIKSLHLKARAFNIILLLLLSMLTITHVFSGLISVVTVLCIYIGSNKMRGCARILQLNHKQLITLTLSIFAVLIFISWHNFVATKQFEDSIRSLSGLIKGEKPLWKVVLTVLRKPYPGALVPFLDLYRYGVYALFTLMGALGLLFSMHKREVKLVFWLGVGVLLGAFAIYLTPATFGVSRLFHYGVVVISILSLYAMVKSDYIPHTWTINKFFRAFKVVIPFLVIGTFLVTNLYNCTYTQFIHSDEMIAAEFIAQKTTKQISVEIDESLVLLYYLKEPIPILAIEENAPPEVAKITFENTELSLQYLPRQLFYYNLSFVGGGNNLIYSNRLAIICSNYSFYLARP